jgi:PKD repeat protein
MKLMLLYILLPLAGFSQFSDTCQVEFEFIVNNENRQVKFSRSNDSVNVVSYLWDFGDGNSSVLGEPTHSYNQPGTYIACLTVTTDNNCMSTFCDTIVIETIPLIDYSLRGTVVTNTSVLPAGYALLIKNNNTDLIYTAVTQVVNGYYEFPDIDPGVYMVQVIPVFNISGYYYPFYLPTYSGNKLLWQQAQPVYVYSNNTTQNIYLCSYNGIITGTQAIRGKICYTQDAGYEEDIFNVNWQDGSPVANPGQNARNIPVLLFNEAGACIKATRSDMAGEFIFENIPYGRYVLGAEKAGITSVPVHVNLQTSEDAQVIHYISFNSAGFLSAPSEEKYRNLRIYPVPANSMLYFTEKAEESFEVWAITGKKLLDFPAGADKADISPLPGGVYYLKFAGGTVFKFVKEQ